MITIIVLLILAGITLSLVIGDNGIINRSKQAGETHTKASIKEEIELTITEIEMEVLSQGEQLTKEKVVEELPNKLSGVIAETAGNEIVGEYKDYDFTIDENFKVILGEKLTGNKPEVTLELMTTTVSPKVQIKVKASVVDSTITELIAPKDITLVQEISPTEKIYEVTKNAIYYFTAKAENGRKAVGKIKISNAFEKPILEEVETTGTTIKVRIPNAIIADGVSYTYYLNNVAKISNTKDSEVILENLEHSTNYTIYVVETMGGQSLTSDPITVKTEEYLFYPIINLSANNLQVTPLDYPLLTKEGMMNCAVTVPTVGQEVTVKITNPNTEGDIYYSIDEGKSWKKYEREFTTTYQAGEKIQAQVKTEKATSRIIKQLEGYVLDLSKDCTQTDALPKEVYDCNLTTSKAINVVDPSYFKIDSTCWGKKIQVWCGPSSACLHLGTSKGNYDLFDTWPANGRSGNFIYSEYGIADNATWGHSYTYTHGGPGVWQEISCE